MIKPLRKKHLQVWSMMMVLLPAAIIGARLATPKAVTDQLLQPTAATPYPVILKTVEKENYTVSIRKSGDGRLQLEWINKKILTAPTATLYRAAADSKKIINAILIGRIEARGAYRFAVDSSFFPKNNAPYELIIYDFIHQQILDSISF